ncbi:MAG: phosphoglucosamine mutase [Gammaproteobacteria bacterium]|jgi:phosphoglucosamine mutase
MNNERKYFGTDGIRGEVGRPPITPDFVLKLGWAAGKVLAGEGRGAVLIGKDTRISGYMFESVLEAGFAAAGVDVRLLGPMPTPAIAYLTRTLHARAGVVISASHNPYTDNGIKFFSAEGTKLPDSMELRIEAMLDEPLVSVGARDLGRAERVSDAAGRYIEFCKSTIPFGLNLSGLRIVVDCAHGATYHVAPAVFGELGAEVIPIGAKPNGLNINDDVGATAPHTLQKAVQQYRADLGIALDGDGDRVAMVDHLGEVLDGDELLLIIADARRAVGALTGPVVGTVMSNLGLEEALRDRGIEMCRSKVGDRHVLEMMRERGGMLGGETSGHIICLDRVTSGDGIVSALQVLHAIREGNTTLNKIKQGMRKYPQILINVRLPREMDVVSLPSVQDSVTKAEEELGDHGRVLLRPSGTEPLVRVMVEGHDQIQVQRIARRIAADVENAINAGT